MNDTATTGQLSVSANRQIKKNVSIQEADNGYVVNLGYGQSTKIAATTDDVLKVVEEFISK